MGAAIDLAATYTEADPNSRISASTVTATFAAIARNEDAYLYKDWGAAYFGDFVHDFETTGTTWANGSKLVVWGLSNTLASKASWAAGLYLQLDAISTTAGTYTLGEISGSTSVGASIAKTIMYWRIERNGTTLTAKRATSAANRLAGTWAETLTITVATTTYQYQYAGSSVNDASAVVVTQTTANYKGTKITSAGTPFDTAYMAGATAGDWDAGATWGNTGSVKGTDYPGTAADAVNIDGPDTITYNVSEANALGQVDVYGILSFKKDSNTKMVLGHQNVNVNGTGELRIGNDADPIGAAYTAELYFTTTADNAKGLICAAASALNIVGSDLTGGTLLTYLIADWSSGQTFTVYGDVTVKWAAGQKIIVYRFLNTFQTGVDCYEYTIASMAANGSDTDITISEAAPGITFRAGGLVAHMTRNIVIGKMSATLTMANYNTNRPTITHAMTSISNSIATTKHACFVGIVRVTPTTYGKWDFTNCIVRNSNNCFGANGAFWIANSVFTDCLFVSINYAPQYWVACTVNGGALICSIEFNQVHYGCSFNNFYVVNHRQNGASVFKNMYGCNIDAVEVVGCHSYFNGTVIGLRVYNSIFGKFRHHANICTPSYDLYAHAVGDSFYFYNCYFTNDPLTVPEGSYWASNQSVNVSFDNFNNVLGDCRRMTQYYQTKSNGTTVRSGGAAKSLEIYRMDDCRLRTLYEPVFEWVEWDAPASEQTRSIYIRGGTGGAEDWSTYPTAAQLFLEAEYYDAAGTTHRAIIASTAVLTDNTTWTQFSVTFTPGRVGHVVYRLRLGVGAASVKLYVDPQLNAA
jgi:hypothetical protein